MTENLYWLREILQAELAPLGNIGNQLSAAGEGITQTAYRTDKPPIFPRNNVPGLTAALGNGQYRDWLVFCYSPLPYYRGQAEFFQLVFDRAAAALPRPLPAPLFKKFSSLTLLAALAARAELTTAPKVISSNQLAHLLNVKPQTYRALWQPRFQLLVAAFRAYDEEALAFVSWSLRRQKRRAG